MVDPDEYHDRAAVGIAVTAIVNAFDPSLPLVAGGKMAVCLSDLHQPGLAVELNGVVARDVSTGFDVEGSPALLVPLDVRQPGLEAGPVGVRVVRSGAASLASLTFDCIVTPASSGAASIDAQRIMHVPMALPVRATAAVSILLYPSGYPDRLEVRIACQPLTATSSELMAPLGATASGQYLIGIEIDGISSTLDYRNGNYTGPLIIVSDAAP